MEFYKNMFLPVVALVLILPLLLFLCRILYPVEKMVKNLR